MRRFGREPGNFRPPRSSPFLRRHCNDGAWQDGIRLAADGFAAVLSRPCRFGTHAIARTVLGVRISGRCATFPALRGMRALDAQPPMAYSSCSDPLRGREKMAVCRRILAGCFPNFTRWETCFQCTWNPSGVASSRAEVRRHAYDCSRGEQVHRRLPPLLQRRMSSPES